MSDKTILLVDDDSLVLNTIKTFLTRSGYRVITATGAEDAMFKFENSKNLIDAVIVDLIMEGLNGIQVLRHVKECCPNVKVMIITAYADVESAVEALRFKADDYLLKPFEFSELSYRVANFFIGENSKAIQD